MGVTVGDYVLHRVSGWAGYVEQIDGHLVTVRPNWPRPLIYGDGSPVGDEWKGWMPITVYAAELEKSQPHGDLTAH